MRPDDRPRKLTRRSASPRGKVFRMMASVSRAGIRCRRADAASNTMATLSESHAHAELIYLSYDGPPRNDSVEKTKPRRRKKSTDSQSPISDSKVQHSGQRQRKNRDKYLP